MSSRIHNFRIMESQMIAAAAPAKVESKIPVKKENKYTKSAKMVEEVKAEEVKIED